MKPPLVVAVTVLPIPTCLVSKVPEPAVIVPAPPKLTVSPSMPTPPEMLRLAIEAATVPSYCLMAVPLRAAEAVGLTL